MHQTGPDQFIRIRGARTHNLKSVDVDLPRDELIVVTGPSGSGKSSLAFDTLHAEGQRQYLESLSAYSRQFLGQMERPDVDQIDGLQPTLCIDQKSVNQNPRSTVGTITEIHDYLRVLFARAGVPHCYKCGLAIQQQSREEIQEQLLRLEEGTKLMILSPLVRGRKGQHAEVLAGIRKSGFLRVRIDGQIYDVEQLPKLAAKQTHHIDLIVDRVIVRPSSQDRIGESLDLALEKSDGLISVCYLVPDAPSTDDWQEKIYSTQFACPDCEVSIAEIEPRTFSFNSPYGACPDCDGLGKRTQFVTELILDASKSLADGAFVPHASASAATKKKQWQAITEAIEQQGLKLDAPVEQWSPQELDWLLFATGNVAGDFTGLVTMLEKEFATTTSSRRQQQLEGYRQDQVCSRCSGSRLCDEARLVTLGDLTLGELSEIPLGDLREKLAGLNIGSELAPVATPILSEVDKRLSYLTQVGVDYLSLSRSADTLSGGELQRVRLATSLGSGLVGVCFVLDEPSIGLHQRDNERLVRIMRELQQSGNTVVVVEHDEAIMREADYLIDVGPGAGEEGGEIVAAGAPDQVMASESITAKYLRGDLAIAVPASRRRALKSKSLVLAGASHNNLRDVTAHFPLHTFTCVTGVSGSGKSSLVIDTLMPAMQHRTGAGKPQVGAHTSLRGANAVEKVVSIDQSPIGRSTRSNAATYTGVFDEIRKIFAATKDAKQQGFRANRFSFNVASGHCVQCQGNGVQRIEMNFLPDVFVKCDACNGTRYNAQTLEVKFRGKSIADVLDLSIGDAAQFFENIESIRRVLASLVDVGLAYLPLGQPSTTISGGEAQRIKLATQLSKVESGNTLYIMDEPTTGLHFDDIRRLLEVFQRLVDRGNTIIVIEHNLDVIKCADWVIEMGPEGGKGGGEILEAGTPEALAKAANTETGRFLCDYI